MDWRTENEMIRLRELLDRACDLLSEFATSEEDFQLVLKTVGECLDMMKLMYDSIYDTVKAVH